MNTIYKCFQGGKTKALTMSYDDGREYDRRLIEIFNKYNIKGTFHLNSNTYKEEDSINIKKYGRRIHISEFPEVYKGHEVSCHTVDHIPLDMCPFTQAVTQVSEDRKSLETVMKYPVRGLSYPYGSYNNEIKRMLPHIGIEYSRAVDITNNFEIPDDFYEWKGTCRHVCDNLMDLCDEFININKKNRLSLMYVWGHSYEFERDGNWDIIERFCKKVGNRDDIWYATNIEIVDYLKAFDNLKFSFDGSFVYNPNFISVWLNVNDNLYEIKGGDTVYFN